MAESAKRHATYADILALDDGVHAEIIDGDLVIRAHPSPEHADAMGSLLDAVFGPYRRGRGGPGGWWILPEVDVQLPTGDCVRPDLSGWRRERVPNFPRGRPVSVRPDWVCEILSSNRRHDVGRKRVLYHASKVSHYWIADPEARTLTVLEWSEKGYVVHTVLSENDKAALPPFDAVEIDVELLFSPLENREE